MGSVNISYFGVFLIFTSGWLMVGWPAYLFSSYKHGAINYKFTLIAATVGFFIGVIFIGIALKLPVLVTVCSSSIIGISALSGIIFGLRKNGNE